MTPENWKEWEVEAVLAFERIPISPLMISWLCNKLKFINCHTNELNMYMYRNFWVVYEHCSTDSPPPPTPLAISCIFEAVDTENESFIECLCNTLLWLIKLTIAISKWILNGVKYEILVQMMKINRLSQFWHYHGKIKDKGECRGWCMY